MSGAVVYGVGVACPLGLSAPAAFAAAGAGIRMFVEIDGTTDAAGQPARGCRLQELPGEAAFDRAVWFAGRASAAALAPLRDTKDVQVPVHVAMPMSSGPADAARRLASVLAETAPSGVRLEWSRPGVVDEGRAGGAAALQAAVASLARVPLSLAGGLDCWVAGAPLADLASRNRLLGLRNCDGRLPGEGAAFMLLGRPGALPHAIPLATVHAVAGAQEPEPFDGPTSGSATALSHVFSQLRTRWDGRVGEVVLAQSTERYWAGELSTAYLRHVELMPEPMTVRHLANAFGDCGAAAFPLGVAWALSDFDECRQGRGDVRSAVVVSSSDGGLVGGALMSAASDGGA